MNTWLAAFCAFSSLNPFAIASSYVEPASIIPSNGLLNTAPPIAPVIVVTKAPSPKLAPAVAPTEPPIIAAGIKDIMKGNILGTLFFQKETSFKSAQSNSPSFSSAS